MYKKEIIGKNNNGKNILILAGVHGDELTSIYCNYLLSKHDYSNFDFKKITIINSINKTGIIKNERIIPNTSTSDLNRMFSREDFDIKNILEIEINNHDIIIDIHTSPKCDNFVLLNQDETTNSYVNYCKKNNINYLIRYSSANTIKKYCIDLGKISFTLELNMMNYIDFKSAEEGKNIILNIIKNNNIIIKEEEPNYDTYIELQTYKSGLFISEKKCGDIIKENDIIGSILDIDKHELFEIKCKYKGKYRIICFGATNYVDANNSICFLQPLD
jgi:predicted deacylase